MSHDPDISTDDFEAARAAVRKLGESMQVNKIEGEIIDLQIYSEYNRMLSDTVLNGAEIRRQLRDRLGVSDGRIRYVLYKKF